MQQARICMPCICMPCHCHACSQPCNRCMHARLDPVARSDQRVAGLPWFPPTRPAAARAWSETPRSPRCRFEIGNVLFESAWGARGRMALHAPCGGGWRRCVLACWCVCHQAACSGRAHARTHARRHATQRCVTLAQAAASMSSHHMQGLMQLKPGCATRLKEPEQYNGAAAWRQT